MTAFLSTLAVAAILLFWGSQDAAGDMALERGAIWALMILAFPFVYLWYFARTPAILDYENQTVIHKISSDVKSLSTQLSQKRTTQEIVHMLSILTGEGRLLVGKRISEEEFNDWLSKYNDWAWITLKFLATVFSQQDATNFNSIMYERKRKFVYAINEQHNDKLNEFQKRLSILEGISSRYQDIWAPIDEAGKKRLEEKLNVFKMQALATRGNKTLEKKSS